MESVGGSWPVCEVLDEDMCSVCRTPVDSVITEFETGPGYIESHGVMFVRQRYAEGACLSAQIWNHAFSEAEWLTSIYFPQSGHDNNHFASMRLIPC